LAKKNDTIASVCKVMSSQEEDVEEAEVVQGDVDSTEENATPEAPLVDFEAPSAE
jgi:DNA gyrase subunit A